MITMKNNLNTRKSPADIFGILKSKRRALQERLKALTNKFHSATSSPNSLFGSLIEFAANALISILNIFLSLLGFQLPTLGTQKSTKDDGVLPEFDNRSEITGPEPLENHKPQVSRAGAMRSDLNLKQLGATIPESVYRNITISDLRKLDSLRPDHVNALQSCSLEAFKPKFKEFYNQPLGSIFDLPQISSDFTSNIDDTFVARRRQLMP